MILRLTIPDDDTKGCVCPLTIHTKATGNQDKRGQDGFKEAAQPLKRASCLDA